MDTFETVARDLGRMPDKVVRQGRGIGAKALNAAAAESRQLARTLWTRRGTGTSAAQITARMSNSDPLAGYVIGDGRGGFFQEVGTGFHPPQPVLAAGVERAAARWAEELGDAGSKL